MNALFKNFCKITFIFFSFQVYAKDIKNDSLVTQGKKIYVDNCVMCHGEKGDGNGPVGKNLIPKPKHLKAYNAKQIIKILNDGKVDMMSHLKSGLTENQKEAVSQYAEKTFSSK
ncbi:c-type cytochrome [Fluviispira multicolorata]|uniref:C-type cytochrome n=1 Tax=Fluviispira multicolorata TaxID=2654512 RepID=A0A833JBL4_9BACT|nr:c-type cytochrome [Fluviispira multicolorata]KAB8029706.1 c-type cytochrome [Fluviispira multicolorata]